MIILIKTTIIVLETLKPGKKTLDHLVALTLSTKASDMYDFKCGE